MAQRQKISQMTPKGANLQPTDLLEISELSGTGYITKSITGQEIINAGGGGGSQDLQQVTNIGSTTTNPITITNNGSSDTLIVNHTSGSGIGVMITKGGNGEGLKVDKTSGSGNAATVIGTLEASNIVKTGGLSTQFLMADGSVSSASSKFTIIGNPLITSAAGLTRFVSPFQVNNSTSENSRSMVIPFNIIIKKLYIGTGNVQPVSGSSIFTLRKNGVATSIITTVPAGSASGVFVNSINSVSFLAGDLISIEHVNNASVNSATINQISISE